MNLKDFDHLDLTDANHPYSPDNPDNPYDPGSHGLDVPQLVQSQARQSQKLNDDKAQNDSLSSAERRGSSNSSGELKDSGMPRMELTCSLSSLSLELGM